MASRSSSSTIQSSSTVSASPSTFINATTGKNITVRHANRNNANLIRKLQNMVTHPVVSTNNPNSKNVIKLLHIKQLIHSSKETKKSLETLITEIRNLQSLLKKFNPD